MTIILLATVAPAQTNEKPSIFESLWSRIAPGSDDPAPETAGRNEAVASPEAKPASEPSLSTARWIGFTPVIVADAGAGEGAWVAGPFAETGSAGWISDTVSGLTAQVTLVWRESAEGSLAEISAEAGDRLGLLPGAVTNVTIYLAE
jgi:hypothetical protein